MASENDSVPQPPSGERRRGGRPAKPPLDPLLLSKLRRQVGIVRHPTADEQTPAEETASDREIIGTVRLQPEKNFFDQPPFDAIISGASQSSGVPDSALRFLLRRLIHHHQIEATSKMTELIASPKLNDLNSFFQKTADRNAYSHVDTRDAIRGILYELRDYPEADVYIASQLKLRSRYKNDGTYSPHRALSATDTALPPSYMSWWEERRERFARMRTGYIMVAATEAFSQDETIHQGPRPATRSWRIRRISEIQRETRKHH